MVRELCFGQCLSCGQLQLPLVFGDLCWIFVTGKPLHVFSNLVELLFELFGGNLYLFLLVLLDLEQWLRNYASLIAELVSFEGLLLQLEHLAYRERLVGCQVWVPFIVEIV